MDNEILPSYCSSEVSLKLQELGFDVPCNSYYSLSHTSEDWNTSIVGEYTNFLDHYHKFVGSGLKNSDLKTWPCGRNSKCMTRPTFDLVIKWIYKNYNIWIDVNLSPIKFFKFAENFKYKFQVILDNKLSGDYLYHSADDNTFFDIPDEAYNYGILYYLNNFQNNGK